MKIFAIIKIFVLSLVSYTFADAAMAREVYVGQFTLNTDRGDSVTSDLQVISNETIIGVYVTMYGGCSFAAQVLHHSPNPVELTYLNDSQYQRDGSVRYHYVVNNGFGVKIVGLRGSIDGFPGARCVAYASIVPRGLAEH